MAERFDRPITDEEREALTRQVFRLPGRPALAVVCLGELPPFVQQDCAACGIYCEQYALPLGLGQADLTDLLEGLAQRGDLDGVLLWPALPAGWDSLAVSRGKLVSAPAWAQVLELAVARAEQRG